MEESWDDVPWDDDGQLKEWYVEYIAVVNEKKYHHMTILFGENMEEAQRSLLHEVKRAYTSSDRIDITIVTMKQTEQDSNDALFEGIFVP